jgi:hypothetical protein
MKPQFKWVFPLLLFCVIESNTLYSQEIDTLFLNLPEQVVIYGSCWDINCIDSIYLISDTLNVLLITEPDGKTRPSHTINIYDSINMYVYHCIYSDNYPTLRIIKNSDHIFEFLIINYVEYNYYFQRTESDKNTFEYLKTTKDGMPYFNDPPLMMNKRQWKKTIKKHGLIKGISY